MRPSHVRTIVGIVFALLLLVSITIHPTRALNINVPCDAASLSQAIQFVNGSIVPDTLNLAPDCLYLYTVGDATNNDSALPRITSEIVINGNGAIIARVSSAPQFRLLFVASSGGLTLNNVTATNGYAANGGGIFNESGGTTIVTNSTISGNSSDYGGGILNSSGTLVVMNSSVSDNFAGVSGGGIYNTGTLTVSSSTISGNIADSTDGGIFNAGTLTISSSTISGNFATSFGGGISNAGTLTVSDSTISGNSASAGGGVRNMGVLTAINSTISGNTAGIWGGGVLTVPPATLMVINSTISGNSASVTGGGVATGGGGVTITSSTISGNSASGIYVGGGSAAVTNSIVWGNSSQISGTATVTYSNIQGGYTGTGNIDADPLFFDQWGASDSPTIFGDYRLQDGSPALNVGDNAALPADTYDLDSDLNTVEPIPFDRDGNTRVVNSIVDMGAYEHQTVFAQELLDNGGFEDDVNADKVPDGWTLINKTGDKLLCDPAKAHSGNCAFKFKGGVPENAKLSQVVDLTGLTFAAGDTLSLSAWFKGVSTAAKTKFILSVTYAGNPIPVKTKLTVKQNAGYTLRSVADYALTAGTVDQIKVTFQHKSTAGSVFVDDASLLYTPGGGPRGTRSDILPPPLAPQGFRGGN